MPATNRIRTAAWSALLFVLLGAVRSYAANFAVVNVNDSGPGSLRQAILDSNNTPGPNVIEFSIAGAPPYVIKPVGQFLPPLKGPVVVRNKPVALADPTVVLDGSNLVKPRTPSACPGATFAYNAQTSQWGSSNVKGDGPNVRGYYGAGLSVHDSHDVEISGIQIQHFCAGIATVRSNGVYIHDVKIVDSQGAAGVIFTGDDGSSGRTDLSFNNGLFDSVLLDNGDGFEFTRGAHDSIIQGNMTALTQPLPENGNAIEFASAGDNNAVIGNTFTKYVDVAVTVSGNHHTIRDNKFLSNQGGGLRASGNSLRIEGNTFLDNGGNAIAVSGTGTLLVDNVVSGSGGVGIVVGGPGITVSRNSIYNNTRLGIDVAGPPSPNSLVLDASSKWTSEGLVLNGSWTADPSRTYTIEIFGSRAADRHPAIESGWGEGEKYLGTASATTDANGKATFTLPLVKLSDPFGNGQTTGFFTATATDSAGSTSRFSQALRLEMNTR